MVGSSYLSSIQHKRRYNKQFMLPLAIIHIILNRNIANIFYDLAWLFWSCKDEIHQAPSLCSLMDVVAYRKVAFLTPSALFAGNTENISVK